eukprot:jgi/Ulvmu1/3528/UM163_0010.1
MSQEAPTSPPLPPPPPPPADAAPGSIAPTVVFTAQELQDAVLAGAQHVEIRSHMDLRQLAVPENPGIEGTQSQLFALLYASGDLQSIRGHCSESEPRTVLSLDAADEATLLPLMRGQCLLLLDAPWLMINRGSVWIDNLYLKRTLGRVPGLAFISAGALNNALDLAGVEQSDTYVTNAVFQAHAPAAATAVTIEHSNCSVYIAGCVFTDWAGDLAPLAIKHESVAHVRNSTFLNMQLRAELVDVSYGGIVQFFRNSLGNVTLGHRAVVSTTTNDYDFILEPYAGAQVEYNADDEDEAKETQASIDVIVVQAQAPFWSEYMIPDGVRSDCMYQRTGVNVTMPGCNPGSVQQRARVRQRSSEPPAGPQAGFPYLDPEALMRQRLHESNSTWLSSMRQAWPALQTPDTWAPFVLPPPSWDQPSNPIFPRNLIPTDTITTEEWSPELLASLREPPDGITGNRVKGLYTAMVIVLVVVPICMAAASVAAWLWVAGRWPFTRLTSVNGSRQPTGPKQASTMRLQLAERRPQYELECARVTNATVLRNVIPASSLNPDYEYALPRHLALFTGPGATSTAKCLSTSITYEPGNTVVVPPYTVTLTASCSNMVVLRGEDVQVETTPTTTSTPALDPAGDGEDGSNPMARSMGQDGSSGHDAQLFFRPVDVAGPLDTVPDQAGDSKPCQWQHAQHARVEPDSAALPQQVARAETVKDRRARRLARQLDGFTRDDPFLGQLELLGSRHRRRGGQAVVQFAHGTLDGCKYAIKFFLDAQAFATEAALYAACFPHVRAMVSPEIAAKADGQVAGIGCVAQMCGVLAPLLPQVDAAVGIGDARLVDARGRPLPPCIVMEKGESLEDWSERAEPDRFTAIAVLSNISKRLADMHDAGYVHRDLKPANVILLPRQNRWTIIDFGCVARTGEHAPLSFTLAYAAPEVAEACHARRELLEVSPALDAWALGVIAIELLTGAPAFDMLSYGFDGLIERLRGDQPLPWEEEESHGQTLQRALGAFREPVLQLLRRDLAQRCTMRGFNAACDRVFNGDKSGKPQA